MCVGSREQLPRPVDARTRKGRFPRPAGEIQSAGGYNLANSRLAVPRQPGRKLSFREAAMIKSWRDDQNLPPLVLRVLSRRSMLTCALAGTGRAGRWHRGRIRSIETRNAPAAEAEEIAAAEKVARDGKLGPLRHSTSEHFLAIGNAPDEASRGCAQALRITGTGFSCSFSDTRIQAGLSRSPAHHRDTQGCTVVRRLPGRKTRQGRGRLLRPRHQAALDL